ncbi:inositol monophosphatase family protein [Micromonospora chalcea]|uniref:inositol monophosphatase family protein n=1 Tax=Micromonospora sp. TSRI0369 TaxID=1703936 RepID=UPI00093AB681|nr:inositol monophosphatase family protein [Micromonospora sp. TSRI0369]OKJ39743.1 myo-inositol-1-monophosphatase [Micromonospora sp. TSRI0369]
MSTYQDLLPVATEAVRRAARAMRQGSPGVLTLKGDRDVASELDFAIERDVRAFLAAETPGIGFLGEEEGDSGRADLRWVLDPIDGTANFLRRLPMCAVSLALVHQNNPVLGMIELPFLGSLYTAVEGCGAQANGQRITVSKVDLLKDAIVAIGDYAVGAGAETKNALRLALTAQLASRAQRVRMTGSAALDLAWLAEGRLDAAITLSNHLWDMAAGIIIAREAGAFVVDRQGNAHDSTSQETLAASPLLMPAILDLYRSAAAEVAD